MQVPGRVSVMRCVFILFIYVIHILIYIAMSNLFLFTFVMLVITFFIGFFVALIIKVIASWADLLDFCQLHREELAEIKGLRNCGVKRWLLRFKRGERT